MNAYIAQIRMNLRLTFRDRAVLIFGYVFPLMFFFMFGQLGHAAFDLLRARDGRFAHQIEGNQDRVNGPDPQVDIRHRRGEVHAVLPLLVARADDQSGRGNST